MNIVKKAYQFIYYKIYKFCESMPHPWWSEAKAMSIVDMLIVFIFASIYIYYNIYIDRSLDLLSNKLYVVFFLIIIVFIPNYFIFSYRDKWKKIVKDFDQLPKKKNRLGGWLVLVFVILIFANLFYSFYLYGQIDWSQYR